MRRPARMKARPRSRYDVARADDREASSDDEEARADGDEACEDDDETSPKV
jgi:hypothetical protein